MYAVVSIYEHDGLEAIVEAVVPSYEVAKGLVSEVANFRADQTYGPRIVVAPIVGPIRLSRNAR